jgi:hypothetical protein
MKYRALLWAVSQMLRWLEHEAHQHLVPRLRMHGSPVHLQGEVVNKNIIIKIYLVKVSEHIANQMALYNPYPMDL